MATERTLHHKFVKHTFQAISQYHITPFHQLFRHWVKTYFLLSILSNFIAWPRVLLLWEPEIKAFPPVLHSSLQKSWKRLPRQEPPLWLFSRSIKSHTPFRLTCHCWTAWRGAPIPLRSPQADWPLCCAAIPGRSPWAGCTSKGLCCCSHLWFLQSPAKGKTLSKSYFWKLQARYNLH